MLLDKCRVRRVLSSRLRDRGIAYITLVSLCGFPYLERPEVVVPRIEKALISVLERVEKSSKICRIGDASFLILHGVGLLDAVKKVESSIIDELRSNCSSCDVEEDILVLTFEVSLEYGNTSRISYAIFHICEGLVEANEQAPSCINDARISSEVVEQSEFVLNLC